MRGTLFIVAAPSGAGKSSIVNAVLKDTPGIALSISYTSRAPRPGERHAQHYHFIGADEFQRMIAAGDFFEHALVHGDYKGTARQSVEPQLAAGHGRAAGDRLAGRAPGPRADAGRAQRVHPAAVARGAGIAHAQPRPGQRGNHRPAGWPRPARR